MYARAALQNTAGLSADLSRGIATLPHKIVLDAKMTINYGFNPGSDGRWPSVGYVVTTEPPHSGDHRESRGFLPAWRWCRSHAVTGGKPPFGLHFGPFFFFPYLMALQCYLARKGIT